MNKNRRGEAWVIKGSDIFLMVNRMKRERMGEFSPVTRGMGVREINGIMAFSGTHRHNPCITLILNKKDAEDFNQIV